MKEKIILAMLFSVCLIPSAFALNLTYGECATISNTSICAPVMPNVTVDYANCTTMFIDNCSKSVNSLTTIVHSMNDSFTTGYGTVTSKFVNDCLGWKSQLSDANLKIEQMGSADDNLTATAAQLTQCNTANQQYATANTQYYNESTFWQGEFGKIKDTPNMYGIGGLLIGAGVVWWLTHRKKQPDYHGKEGYSQTEGSRTPVKEENLKPKAESPP